MKATAVLLASLLLSCATFPATTGPGAQAAFELVSCVHSDERLSVAMSDPQRAAEYVVGLEARLRLAAQHARAQALTTADVEAMVDAADLSRRIAECAQSAASAAKHSAS